MKVLVDSSVWIEFFSSRPAIPLDPLESLIEERQIATCLPIKTEVLSGRMSESTRKLLLEAFDAMDFIDLDWNSSKTWEALIEFALLAQKKKASLPGLVDRMILACCQSAGSPLWTLDRKLSNLAKALKLPLFNP